eukprot:2154869-Pleurochrysis_carterae.AAC.2
MHACAGVHERTRTCPDLLPAAAAAIATTRNQHAHCLIPTAKKVPVRDTAMRASARGSETVACT